MGDFVDSNSRWLNRRAVWFFGLGAKLQALLEYGQVTDTGLVVFLFNVNWEWPVHHMLQAPHTRSSGIIFLAASLLDAPHPHLQALMDRVVDERLTLFI